MDVYQARPIPVVREEWTGGKPAGSIKGFKTRWEYRRRGSETKSFFTKDYGGDREIARREVEAYLKSRSEDLNLTKNRWRKVSDSIGGIEYCELEIISPKHGVKIMLFDLIDLDIAEKYTWCVRRCTDEHLYASAAVPKDERQDSTKKKSYSFHNLATGFEFVDHRNHDTLDNRRSNLVDSNPKLNSRNKTQLSNNTSGTTGVYKRNVRGYDYWVAKWFDEDKKKTVSLHFSIEKYGNDEAYNKALDVRKTAEQPLGMSVRKRARLNE